MADGVLERTRQSDLQPLIANGVPVFRMYGQIRIELLRALSQDHLGLFADPNPDPTSGDIQWFAPNPGEIVKLADCTEDERSGHEFHLARLVDDITHHIERLNRGDDDARNMANVLTMALEIPDESHIFVVGGVPVLAGWGHVPRGPAVLRKPLIALVKRVLSIAPPPEPEHAASPPPPPPPEPEPAPGAAEISPPPPGEPPAAAPVTPDGTRVHALIPIVNEVVSPARVGGLGWALWPILAVLLVAIGYLLLRYCALGWPLSLLADHNLILNYCIASNEPLRNNDLTSHLADLQAALTEKQRRLCAATPPPRPTPTPTPTPTPSPTQSSRERVEREGGRIGAVNVILTWNTDDDLDLHVTCPDGKVINYSTRNECRGVLDVDANSNNSNKTTSPAENVTWPEGAAPSGTYKVEVHPYNQRNSGQPIDFKVELLVNREVKETHNLRAESSGKIPVFEFTLPYTRRRQ